MLEDSVRARTIAMFINMLQGNRDNGSSYEGRKR